MYNLENITLDANNIIRDKSTSDGSQIKYNYNNKWYKIDKFGGEAESETLVSLLLECSNMPEEKYVRYSKININGQLGCVSNDFRLDKNNEEFITFYRLYKNLYGHDLASITSRMDYDDAIMYVIDFVKDTLDLDTTAYLANIFYLDEIILNTDRHFNNYGIIMANDSYREAPIFDNGKSLLTGQKCIETDTIDKIIKEVYSKSFSPNFKLNSDYLKKYRTLEFEKDKILEKLEHHPDSLQKNVLLYQINKLL